MCYNDVLQYCSGYIWWRSCRRGDSFDRTLMFLIKRFILKVHINNCNKGPGSRNRDNRRNPRGNEMYTLWHIINRAYKLTVICGYKLHITWRRCNDILFPLTILRQLRTNSNKCLRQKLNVILWWNNGRFYLPFLDTIFNYVSSPAHLNGCYSCNKNTTRAHSEIVAYKKVCFN